MEQIPEGMHPRRPTTRRDGTPVRGTIARNPRPRRKSSFPVPPPPTPPRRRKVGLAIGGLVVSLAVGGVIAVTATLGGSGGNSRSLSVQVKVDLNQAIAELAKLGFHLIKSIDSNSISDTKDCTKDSNGKVKQFLEQHPCKEYAVARMTARRQETTTQLVISWVVMPTPSLAEQYQAWTDKPGKGNPPGQPRGVFNGNCYAAGRNGATVWVEQVQPTENVKADQAILQAAAPTKLPKSYFEVHCTE